MNRMADVAWVWVVILVGIQVFDGHHDCDNFCCLQLLIRIPAVGPCSSSQPDENATDNLDLDYMCGLQAPPGLTCPSENPSNLTIDSGRVKHCCMSKEGIHSFSNSRRS